MDAGLLALKQVGWVLFLPPPPEYWEPRLGSGPSSLSCVESLRSASLPVGFNFPSHIVGPR